MHRFVGFADPDSIASHFHRRPTGEPLMKLHSVDLGHQAAPALIRCVRNCRRRAAPAAMSAPSDNRMR